MPETVTEKTCLRCAHSWLPRSGAKPTVCPKCHSPYWDRRRGG